MTKTLAFILKTQDFRDTSLLGDFYTRDHGRIRGILKGARDARARFGSTLEPFSLNEILFYKRRRGGDLHLVTQAELVDLYPAVRGDLERLASASYFTELVRELVETDEAHPEIFDLMQDSLLFLSSGASPKRAARIFEIKLFKLLGLMPEIRNCVVCHAADPDPAYFNVSAGGIHCPAHRDLKPSFPISRGTLNFLDHATRLPLQSLYPVKVSQTVGEELEKVLRRFTDFHLSHKLKSIVFMEKMGML